jgi:hypothetical protein
MALDISAALSQLDALKSIVPALQESLKNAAVDKAVADGGEIVVRPVMFRQPVKSERDPWFGLTCKDWVRFRKEGFDGWMIPNEAREGGLGKGRAPVIMIFTERAAKWLAERAAAQRAAAARGE